MKKITILLALICALITLTLSVSAFSDVNGDEWYAEAAMKLYDKQLMVGNEYGEFMPKRGITRAEACCVITKALVGPVDKCTEVESVFNDCGSDDWYTPYVMWCYDRGFVKGCGEAFLPDWYLRREQLAVILQNVCESYSIKNKCPTLLTLDSYTDTETASEWAVPSLSFAVFEGYLTGVGNNELAPWKYVPRSEFAVIIRNLLSVMQNGILPVDDSGADAYGVTENDRTRIVCWGDSLTAGVNVDPFPRVLQNKLGVRCVNYGVGGETAELIAMRQGALGCYVMPVEIPAFVRDVPITFCNEKGRRVDLSYFGVAGLSPVVIGGVEGNVFYSEDDKTAVFRRLENGEGVTLNRVTRVVTKGMRDRNTGDVGVYFIGSNNGFDIDDAEYFASLIESMISYSGSEKYVVIGLTSKSYTPDVDEINEFLSKRFGDNFLDVRAYFMTDALSDSGIIPTEQDIKDIENGEIPSSLRVDSVHGNQIFNNIIADMLSEKAVELGYVNK